MIPLACMLYELRWSIVLKLQRKNNERRCIPESLTGIARQHPSNMYYYTLSINHKPNPLPYP